jgi:hypothetical protein
MSRLLDFLTGRKRRDPLTNFGYSEASDAFQDLTSIMQPPDVDRSTLNADALRQDMLYLSPLGGLLRSLQGLEPAFRGVTGTGVGATQSTLEGLGMGENSSDRLGRDLMAITNEVPFEAITAQMAGLLGHIADYASGVKKSRPYLLGEKLETNPDVNMVGKAGKPAAVRINDERYSSREIAEIKNAEEKYLKEAGIEVPDYIRYPKQDEKRAKLIAAAYEKMQNNPNDPEVIKAYQALIDETMAQYKALKDTGLNFTFLKPNMPDPYAASPALGYKDVVENKNLTVFPTDFGYGSDAAFDASKNPMLTKVGKIGDKEDAVANDAFRVVHDTFGHLGSGNPQFRSAGEERAFLQHMRMYTPEARRAMAAETRGQNSFVNFGPYANQNRGASGADTIYADQKVGIMPDWAVDPEGMPDGLELKELEEIIKTWGD